MFLTFGWCFEFGFLGVSVGFDFVVCWRFFDDLLLADFWVF